VLSSLCLFYLTKFLTEKSSPIIIANRVTADIIIRNVLVRIVIALMGDKQIHRLGLLCKLLRLT